MRSVDYRKFERLTGHPGEIAELLLHMGSAKGDYLVEWLGNVLADLGVHTFADLAIADADDPRQLATSRAAVPAGRAHLRHQPRRWSDSRGTTRTTARTQAPSGWSMRSGPA